MIDPVNPVGENSISYAELAAAAARAERTEAAKKEFLTMFYKELLKQAIKTPNLSLGDPDQEENNISSSYGSDLLVEKLAGQLAEKAASQINWQLGAEGTK